MPHSLSQYVSLRYEITMFAILYCLSYVLHHGVSGFTALKWQQLQFLSELLNFYRSDKALPQLASLFTNTTMQIAALLNDKLGAINLVLLLVD